MAADKPISVSLVSPDRELFSAQVERVSMPSVLGPAEILPGHARAIMELGPGLVTIVLEGNAREVFAVSGGFAEVTDDKVTILAETAEHGNDIDLERAQKHHDESAANLRAAIAPDEFEAARLKKRLDKALARLEAIRMAGR